MTGEEVISYMYSSAIILWIALFSGIIIGIIITLIAQRVI